MTFAALISGSGCFITSNLNSGKVLPKDEFAFTAGIITISEVDVGSTILGFRYGVGEQMDFGVGMEMFIIKADVRYQFLNSEQHFLDASAEVGMGAIVFSLPVYHVGVGLSKTLGRVTPFAHYRWTGLGLIEIEELWEEDEDNEFTFDPDGWGQISLGMQLHVGEKMSIVAEYIILNGIDSIGGEELSAVAVGVRIGAW